MKLKTKVVTFKYDTLSKPLRINVGSGQRPFEKPWINVDIQERWKPDVVADWRSMPMFDDGAAELIVAHHLLEHSGCREADDAIRECWRILQPGGSLLVFVPDLRKLAQRWLMRAIDDYQYCVNLYGAFMGDDADRHRWGYSADSLKYLLISCGPAVWYGGVKPFDWREVPGADIARDWWILGVEAVK